MPRKTPTRIYHTPEEWLRLLESGKTHADIAKELGIHQMSVNQVSRRLGVKASKAAKSAVMSMVAKTAPGRVAFYAKRREKMSESILRDLFIEKRMPLAAIAEVFSVSKTSIARWIKIYGIELSQSQIKEKNSARLAKRWLNVRQSKRHNAGYALQRVSHPNAHKSGFVFEHRLVAEKMIGRILEKSEHVHHLNFEKSDNRTENLMVCGQSDHRKFHCYMEQVGSYYSGFKTSYPEPIVFNKPVWLHGQWITSYDAFAKSVATTV